MTRKDALKQADAILQHLVASGDPALFSAASGADGKVDQTKLVAACMRARERLADKLVGSSAAHL